MTVAEFLSRVSSHELSEWLAYARVREEERAAAQADQQ